jgi:hypothetical protein
MKKKDKQKYRNKQTDKKENNREKKRQPSEIEMVRRTTIILHVDQVALTF